MPPRPVTQTQTRPIYQRLRRPKTSHVGAVLSAISLIASALFFWQSWAVAKASWDVSVESWEISKVSLLESQKAYQLSLGDHRYGIWKSCHEQPEIQQTDTCQMYACLTLDGVLHLMANEQINQYSDVDAIASYVSMLRDLLLKDMDMQEKIFPPQREVWEAWNLAQWNAVSSKDCQAFVQRHLDSFT